VTDKELVDHLLGPDHGLMPSELTRWPAVEVMPDSDRYWLDATHITHHGCPYPPKVEHAR
jgi:hypothetical protein